ncbi:MAG TPA: hypothetical protein VHO70_22700 [Chitinispirillaceae bacterium]|nr:hypothetical protein [Chitinispirillaceae bacterium]
MAWFTTTIIAAVTIILIFLIFQECYRFRWVLPYIKSTPKIRNRIARIDPKTPVDVYIAFCDHYRPFTGKVSQEIAELRVVTWCREYERIARQHIDSSGNHPVHTVFYSESDYNPYFLDTIARCCRNGLMDVEILIDHNRDTPGNFKRKIEEYRDVLFHHHGLLRKDMQGKITYGFIHGRWALDNARPDGKFCGVHNEVSILKKTGCYADFTYPSAPDITQPPIINSIYFAPVGSRRFVSHEKGSLLQPGTWNFNDLLCIQGPLSITSNNPIHFPITVDRGEIGFNAPFSKNRMEKWLLRAPRINGNDSSIFLKLYTDGMVDKTIRYLFSENGLHQFWSTLEQCYDGNGFFRIHYVSAWSMYNKIRQLCTESSTLNINSSIK